MTLNEAKMFMWKENDKNPSKIQWSHHKTIRDLHDSLITKIYDDLEGRTCENCKHNKEQDGFMIFCDCVMCLDGSRMMWHSYTKDFCCNKWEQK